jgi:hypothetical protein
LLNFCKHGKKKSSSSSTLLSHNLHKLCCNKCVFQPSITSNYLLMPSATHLLPHMLVLTSVGQLLRLPHSLMNAPGKASLSEEHC